jgi:two-component system sensor histidine kinase RegB
MPSKEEIKLRWLVRIRWGAVAAWSILGAVVSLSGLVKASPLPLLVFLIFTSGSNLFLARMGAERVNFLRLGGAVLAFDIALLTGLLFCYGGYANPFSMMFLVYVTIAAFVLNSTWTWWSFGMSSLGFVSLFFYHIPLAGFEMHHHGGGGGFSLHLHGMLIAFLIIGALTSLFLTQMSREVEYQGEKIHQLQQRKGVEEKFLAIATLAAGAAHELSTPIGTLSLITEDLAQSLSNDTRFREDVLLMQSQISRCTRILERMRGEGTSATREELSTVVTNDIVAHIKDQFGEHQVLFDVEHGEVLTYSASLKEALSSLVKNGVQASRESGKVKVNIAYTPDALIIVVTDQGQGMEREELRRIGEPFYTTKSPGDGFGLGVFLVKMFAQRIGGELSINSTPGAGTEVTLTIPREPMQLREAV